MANGPIGIPSRLAFLVCGLISVLVSRVFWALQGFIPAPNARWSLFSAALMVVGGFDVVIALLPGSWVEKVRKISPSSVPLKMLGGFAVLSYLSTVVALNFAPLSWLPSPQLVYTVCPACVLTITVDPSLWTVLLLLAPLNAAVYGSLGAALGYILIALRTGS